MSESRRIGGHPNEFSHAIRSISGGGTIPDSWGCRVVDLDEFYAVLDEQLFRVSASSRIWVWYRRPAEIVAVGELKMYDDLQQSWDVTRSFAARGGVAGFRIVMLPDRTVRITDLGHMTEEFDSPRAFIESRVRPLIEEDLPF